VYFFHKHVNQIDDGSGGYLFIEMEPLYPPLPIDLSFLPGVGEDQMDQKLEFIIMLCPHCEYLVVFVFVGFFPFDDTHLRGGSVGSAHLDPVGCIS
jgi:hypothetical protein